MRDRRVIVSVDGQDSEPMSATTGLPQGSPISPVLFAIYISDIHQAVESQAEDYRGISFVDDVTWLAEGMDLEDVIRKLEKCAEASLEWAGRNAVRFEPRLRQPSSLGKGNTTVVGESKWGIRQCSSLERRPAGWAFG